MSQSKPTASPRGKQWGLSSKHPALTSNPGEQTSNPATDLNDWRAEPVTQVDWPFQTTNPGQKRTP